MLEDANDSVIFFNGSNSKFSRHSVIGTLGIQKDGTNGHLVLFGISHKELHCQFRRLDRQSRLAPQCKL